MLVGGGVVSQLGGGGIYPPRGGGKNITSLELPHLNSFQIAYASQQL